MDSNFKAEFLINKTWWFAQHAIEILAYFKLRIISGKKRSLKLRVSPHGHLSTYSKLYKLIQNYSNTSSVLNVPRKESFF